MKRQTFIQNFVWAGGGAIAMIIFLLAYSTFARLLSNNSPPVFSHAIISIQRADGPPVSLDVEIATSSRQKSYGLMYRHSMPENAGMLFVWNVDQPVAFWMKNTYIPLDMLFVRRDGVIVKIVTHTTPLDATPIPSDESVRGVLEINAGATSRLGIENGDKIIFPVAAQKAPPPVPSAAP